MNMQKKDNIIPCPYNKISSTLTEHEVNKSKKTCVNQVKFYYNILFYLKNKIKLNKTIKKR